jgi:hypothetical protein
MKLTPDEIKKEIKNGTIRAITLDTNVFDRHHLGFEGGSLPRMKQFANSRIRFVMQEVICREVMRHVEEQAEEARVKLRSAIRDAGKMWQLDKDKREEQLRNIIGDESPKQLAQRRFSEFAKEVGIVEIPSGGVDSAELVDAYFEGRAPFGGTGPKKNEFPDAIALKALEAWARKEGVKVMAVSTDEDWKRYAEGSDVLVVVDDLADALSYFNAAAEIPTRAVAQRINQQNLKWMEQLVPSVYSAVEAATIVPDAPAAAYLFDSEITEIDIKDLVVETNEDGTPALTPVDAGDDYLVAKVSATAYVELHAVFDFSVRDSIDRDYVPLGTASGVTVEEFDVNLLVTFSLPAASAEVLDVEAEIPGTHHWIEFDEVEGPDWQDDD